MGMWGNIVGAKCFDGKGEGIGGRYDGGVGR